MSISNNIRKQFEERHGLITAGRPGADGDFIPYTNPKYIELLEKELDHYYNLCTDYKKVLKNRQVVISCTDELAMEQGG